MVRQVSADFINDAGLVQPPFAHFGLNGAHLFQGDEVLVHELHHSDDQKNPDIAMDAAGNFIIVWDGTDVDGNEVPYGIYVMRIEAKFKTEPTFERVNRPVAIIK